MAKISEVIIKLSELKDKYGDLDVWKELDDFNNDEIELTLIKHEDDRILL